MGTELQARAEELFQSERCGPLAGCARIVQKVPGLPEMFMLEDCSLVYARKDELAPPAKCENPYEVFHVFGHAIVYSEVCRAQLLRLL